MAAAYTGVQGNGGSSANANTIATGSITTTTGAILIAFMSWDDTGSTITSMTGGGTGITWTSKIAKFSDGRHGQAFQCYLGTGYTGAAGAVTANLSAGTGFRAISVVEVSGQDTSTQFDVAGVTDVADAGAPMDIAVTTVTNLCLVVAFTFDDSGTNTITKGSESTQINNFTPFNVACTEYITTNPGIGAATATWTYSGTDDGASMIVAVRPAGGAAAAVVAPSTLTLMGMQ